MSGDEPSTGAGEPAAPTPEQERTTLARAALARVKDAAARRGAIPGRRGGGSARDRPPRRVRPGDPELVGAAVDELLTERGWDARATVAALFGRWDQLVGPQVAEHCQPKSYEDGRLLLTADSTAWATHLRALVPDLMHRLGEELGPGVVSEVRISGPTGPSWRRGPRHVRGRGPRDTYG